MVLCHLVFLPLRFFDFLLRQGLLTACRPMLVPFHCFSLVFQPLLILFPCFKNRFVSFSFSSFSLWRFVSLSTLEPCFSWRESIGAWTLSFCCLCSCTSVFLLDQCFGWRPKRVLEFERERFGKTVPSICKILVFLPFRPSATMSMPEPFLLLKLIVSVLLKVAQENLFRMKALTLSTWVCLSFGEINSSSKGVWS